MPREILPTDIQFINYDLTLNPDLEKFTFTGEEHLTYTVNKPTNKIVLNSKEIDVKRVTITNSSSDSEITTDNITYDKELERVTFTFDTELKDGIVSISYTGILNDQMKGFYRSKYTDPNGKEKYAATTQFEATDARRAFLCGDEPALKATFDITLIVPKELTALSNMEVISEEEYDQNKKSVKYKRTPIMSTYLLAFFVGEVDYVEKIIKKPKSGDDLRVRVYTPVGKKEQARFSLDLAAKVLIYYTELFDIDFPLNKMDMIAIPDFKAGAMENWGLITYRTKLILYDPKQTSRRVKAIIAYVICHELAHMWFGNLVTMEWWSDLWLNEGFATWVGWMATDHFFPKWKVWETFIGDEYNRALSLDQLDSSHPIQNDVNKASQIDEIFDAISYSKGSCIIRMLVNHLGKATFMKGLREYLKKYAYSNAVTENLWTALSKASGKNVSKLMDTWVKKMGYPIVYVDQKNDDNWVTFAQEKYCAVKSKENKYNQVWTVPLNIIDGANGKILKYVMDDTVLRINGLSSWFKINAGQTGLYRTKYGPEIRKKLKPIVLNKEIGPVDRADLISNMFAFAVSGHGSVVDALEFLDAYKNEDEYIVWAQIISYLNLVISVWFQNKKIVDKIKFFGLSLIKPLVKSLGWDKQMIRTKHSRRLRKLMISSACKWGDQHTIDEAISRTNKYLDGEDTLNSDLRVNAFSACMKNGDKKTYDKFISYYLKTDNDEIKGNILRALGSTKNRELLSEAYSFVFQSGKVRPQDTRHVVYWTDNSNKYFIWKKIEQLWGRLCELYKDGGSIFSGIVSMSFSGLYNRKWLDEVQQFLDSKENDVSTMKKKISQAFEKANSKIDWLERDNEKLKNYVINNM